jgi:hypothetical protein
MGVTGRFRGRKRTWRKLADGRLGVKNPGVTGVKSDFGDGKREDGAKRKPLFYQGF